MPRETNELSPEEQEYFALSPAEQEDMGNSEKFKTLRIFVRENFRYADDVASLNAIKEFLKVLEKLQIKGEL